MKGKEMGLASFALGLLALLRELRLKENKYTWLHGPRTQDDYRWGFPNVKHFSTFSFTKHKTQDARLRQFRL